MAEARIDESTYEPIGAFHGKYLYRCLREDEDWTIGLAPKNPDATYSVEQHVGGARNTQYISTCASLGAARAWAAHTRWRPVQIVKIDVDKMRKTDVEIINLTDRNVRQSLLKGDKVRNFANKYEEVLVKGDIPLDCITFEMTMLTDN